MPSGDYLIPMGIGGFFVLLGIILIIMGRSEEKHYYDSLASRPDVREFTEHWPERPRVGSVKVGGWVSLAVGLVTIAISVSLWLWG
jgi:hypothetical protein